MHKFPDLVGLFVNAKHCLLNNNLRFLLEIFKSNRANLAPDPGCYVLTTVPDKIRNLEQLPLVLFTVLIYLKVPVVTELKRKLCMIRGFDFHYICHEVRA